LVLQPAESYQASAWVRTPGRDIGAYRWRVDINSNQGMVKGTNRFDNTGEASNETRLDLPELAPDAEPLRRT